MAAGSVKAGNAGTTLRTPRWCTPLATYVVFLLTLVFSFSWIANYDDQTGGVSLQLLRVPVHTAMWVGNHILAQIYPYAIGFGALLIGFFLTGAFTVFARRQTGRAYVGAVAAACSLGIAGQIAFLCERNAVGFVFYLFGVVALAFAHASSSLKKHAMPLPTAEPTPFRATEGIVLLLITLAAAIPRYYALNQTFHNFEGELSVYAAGATSLTGMFRANAGQGGPWAPLGLLYYLPIYLSTSLFGTSITGLRLSSSLVGILTIPLMYLFLRRLGGVWCALFGSAFLAMDSLHIGWSRTDVHPHHVTTWPTLLLCWTTLLAVDTEKHRYFIATAALMGLTWHQYPSGQTAFLIPIPVLAFYLLSDKGFRTRCGLKSLWLIGGIILWVIGLPVSYFPATGQWVWSNPFTLTGPRASWGNLPATAGPFDVGRAVLTIAGEHSLDLIQGAFTSVPYLFFQDFVPQTSPLPMRTIAWPVAAMVPLGLMLIALKVREKRPLILVSWLVVGALPSVLASQAYPKRAATLYPAIEAVAAFFLSWLAIHVPSWFGRKGEKAWKVFAACSFCGYFCIVQSFWLSGRQWAYGTPAEVAVAEHLKQRATPGTVVIVLAPISYGSPKLTFLMLDFLHAMKNRPIFWYPLDEQDYAHFAQILEDPRTAIGDFARVKLSPAYQWTKLEDNLLQIERFRDWKKLIYVVQHKDWGRDHTDEFIERLKTKCSDSFVRIPKGLSMQEDIWIFESHMPDAKPSQP